MALTYKIKNVLMQKKGRTGLWRKIPTFGSVASFFAVPLPFLCLDFANLWSSLVNIRGPWYGPLFQSFVRGIRAFIQLLGGSFLDLFRESLGAFNDKGDGQDNQKRGEYRLENVA